MRSKVAAPPEGVALWWITIHFHDLAWALGIHSRGTPATWGAAGLGATLATGGGWTTFGRCATTGGGAGGCTTTGGLKLGAGRECTTDFCAWHPVISPANASSPPTTTAFLRDVAIHGLLCKST